MNENEFLLYTIHDHETLFKEFIESGKYSPDKIKKLVKFGYEKYQKLFFYFDYNGFRYSAKLIFLPERYQEYKLKIKIYADLEVSYNLSCKLYTTLAQMGYNTWHPYHEEIEYYDIDVFYNWCAAFFEKYDLECCYSFKENIFDLRFKDGNKIISFIFKDPGLSIKAPEEVCDTWK